MRTFACFSSCTLLNPSLLGAHCSIIQCICYSVHIIVHGVQYKHCSMHYVLIAAHYSGLRPWSSFHCKQCSMYSALQFMNPWCRFHCTALYAAARPDVFSNDGIGILSWLLVFFFFWFISFSAVCIVQILETLLDHGCQSDKSLI